MKLFRLSRYARSTSPRATVILLCLGAFLALLPTELEGPTVNADLLSAFLLVVCFGAIVGWLLANGRGRRTFRFVGPDHRPSFVSTLEDRSFLGVFRL